MYSNSKSVKLLLKEVEFWIKVFFLPVYSMTNAVIRYVQGYPLHNICTFFLFSTTILFLVIVFDATKNNTIIDLRLFSQSVLFHFIAMNMIFISFYRAEYVIDDQFKVTMSLFGVGLMTINIMHIFITSTQILAIFVFKQMVSLIIKLIHLFKVSTNAKVQERNNSKCVNVLNEVEIYNESNFND